MLGFKRREWLLPRSRVICYIHVWRLCDWLLQHSPSNNFQFICIEPSYPCQMINFEGITPTHICLSIVLIEVCASRKCNLQVLIIIHHLQYHYLRGIKWNRFQILIAAQIVFACRERIIGWIIIGQPCQQTRISPVDLQHDRLGRIFQSDVAWHLVNGMTQIHWMTHQHAQLFGSIPKPGPKSQASYSSRIPEYSLNDITVVGCNWYLSIHTKHRRYREHQVLLAWSQDSAFLNIINIPGTSILL